MVAKIQATKDNKSPGVDGIPPEQLYGNGRINYYTTCMSVQLVIKRGRGSF